MFSSSKRAELYSCSWDKQAAPFSVTEMLLSGGRRKAHRDYNRAGDFLFVAVLSLPQDICTL